MTLSERIDLACETGIFALTTAIAGVMIFNLVIWVA